MKLYFPQILYNLKRVIAWIPIIWKDRDFDHAFLLKIMEFKLRRMSRLHKHHGVTLDKNRKAKELLIAAELCRRLSLEDVYDNDDDFKFLPERPIEYRCVKAPQNDLDYLCKLFSKHLRGWWD